MKISGAFKLKDRYEGKASASGAPGRRYYKCVDMDEGVNFKVSLPGDAPELPLDQVIDIELIGALNTAGKYGTVLEVSKVVARTASK
jgi:hypothetical protein